MAAPRTDADPPPLEVPGVEWRRLPAPLPVWRGAVDADGWRTAAHAAAASGGRLLSMWGVDRQAAGGGDVACVAYGLRHGLVWAELPLGASATYPDLSATFACAGRMQRAMADLSGLHAHGSAEQEGLKDVALDLLHADDDAEHDQCLHGPEGHEGE